MRIEALVGAVALLTMACSGGDDSSTPSEPDAAAQADASGDAGPVNCANACARPATCSPDLVTEADCNALCTKHEDPAKYACCLQYAATCAQVRACVDGTNLVCEPKGEPWIPADLLQECACGDPATPTPYTAECSAVGPDSVCRTGLCLKPLNHDGPPFCTIDCTNAANKCEAPLVCEKTPRTWYCKNPFN